jgi:uncharacterized protein (DUF983 family)
MFRRAVVRHCPRCGAGHLFRHWFSMVKRCPGCNYQFNREEGSSLGAYTINFGFTIGALGILMLFYIMQLASDSGSVSTVKWLTAAVVVALGVPAIGYPFSWTLWTAIDLTLHRGRFGPSRSADTGRYR